MKTPEILRKGSVLLALLALMAAGARAGDGPDCDKRHAENITIEVDGDEFVVSSRCDGAEKVVTVNMDAVGGLVEEALADVSEVLEEMDEMQVKIHLGEDNMLSFADAETEWEVDLDQIARQVATALQVGLEEFEAGDWSHRRDRHEIRAEASELGDLQRELESLRKELKRLERELEKESGRNGR